MAQVKVALSVGLDVAGTGSCERDVSRVVVFDNLFGESERCAILETLLGPQGSEQDPEPPASLWEKK